MQELVLRQELLLLAERLSRTQHELAALRTEREEMLAYVKEIDGAVRSRGRESSPPSTPTMHPGPG